MDTGVRSVVASSFSNGNLDFALKDYLKNENEQIQQNGIPVEKIDFGDMALSSFDDSFLKENRQAVKPNFDNSSISNSNDSLQDVREVQGTTDDSESNLTSVDTQKSNNKDVVANFLNNYLMTGLSKDASFGDFIKWVVTNPSKSNEWLFDYGFREGLKALGKEGTKYIFSEITKESIKNLGKLGGYFGGEVGKCFFPMIGEYGIKAYTALIDGEDFDYGTEFIKAAVKTEVKLGVNLLTFYITYQTCGDLSLAKSSINAYVDGLFLNAAKNNINYDGLVAKYSFLSKQESNPISRLYVKGTPGRIANEEANILKLGYKDVNGIIHVDKLQAFKNIGLPMAGQAAINSFVSIAGNVLVGTLIEGKSFGEAISDTKWGEEILKGSVTAIFQTAGGMIGGAAGKFIGGMIGSAIGTLAVEPFRDADGNVDQFWCAAAGAGVLVGGAIGTACLLPVACSILAACGIAGPVGWIAAGCLIVGAALGYFVVWLLHLVDWESVWNSVVSFFEDVADVFIAIGTALYEAGKAVVEFISDVGDAVIEGAKAVCSALVSAGQAVVEFAKDVGDAVIEGIENLGNALVEVGKELIEFGVEVKDWCVDRLNDAKELINDAGAWVLDALESARNWASARLDDVGDIIDDVGDWCIWPWNW